MSTKLFIGSLAWGVTDSSLKEAFAPFGEIVEGTHRADTHHLHLSLPSFLCAMSFIPLMRPLLAPRAASRNPPPCSHL